MAAKPIVRWAVEDRTTGMPVAHGCAPTEEEACREVMHYAVQYSQDGPVRYWVRHNRNTVLQGELAVVHKTLSGSAALQALQAATSGEKP